MGGFMSKVCDPRCGGAAQDHTTSTTTASAPRAERGLQVAQHRVDRAELR